MSTYTYLYATEDSDGVPLLFEAEKTSSVNIGDLVEYDGELFPIVDKTMINTQSDEYRIFDRISGIRKPDRLFALTWENKKEGE